MTKILKLLLATLSLAGFAQPARCAPLEATKLYSQTAHGCRTLDISTWSHPTRQVLDRAHVEIRKVELCNRDLYPVFTVRFDATPMLGVNDRYFNKLYAAMAEANGWHSFSFVDPTWEVVATVDVTGKRSIAIAYEEFDTPPGQK